VSEPALTIVVASVNGFPYLGKCLDALVERAPESEVIVADSTDEETRRKVGEGWSRVRLLSFPEVKTVPELRAAGAFAASAPFVAMIEDHCVVPDRWAASILDAHRHGHEVVGGPIRNVATRRLRDWAAFLFEYSAFIEPAPRGPVVELTGMNVSYGRHAIEAVRDLLQEGKWESWLHSRLREQGYELYCEPEAVIAHDKEFGIAEFVSQRFHYSRAHAAMRNPELGRRRVVYAVGSPLLVPLLYWRVARNVFRRRRHRREFLLGTPLLLVYVTVTAVGEALGYVVGDRGSLSRVR
jgi:GT2 family glycosyltransferase